MSNTIHIAICDDENIQVDLLDSYVRTWGRENELKVNIDYFYSGESFEFTWTRNKKYHILLLDIEMPGINGMELARRIRKEDNYLNIIFITAIPDYIGEGYDVSAINYLIKPISEKKLYECLDKTILIDVDGEIIRINQKEIIYIESISHHIEIKTVNNIYKIRKILDL